MTHKELSEKAVEAMEAYKKSLAVAKVKTRQPFMMAMVGLVGSGKSTVASRIAEATGAVIVRGDSIRVELRRVGEEYKYTDVIAQTVIRDLLRDGCSVVVDSDCVIEAKRIALAKIAQEFGRRFLVVRVHCNPEIAIGRMLTASYADSVEDIFGGSKKVWTQGTPEQQGAAIKIKEMWRRTPFHYEWFPDDGGVWRLRNFDFKIDAVFEASASGSGGFSGQLETFVNHLIEI